ncbi:hypothetical protein N825_10580 [Skermanella stibiiresistens SB22]|uniref:Surface antigen domain-containing protein n=1 Tax=Skermanella stibiiresistens SB22 TaxID=1385369 RepID=W9H2C9_9PROT|nr:DVU3141 family protein [Skermanella stibiiresistens]EWY38966.1 hypothetical protein N825_10580 [Skermanella stibiiresistens SB22]
MPSRRSASPSRLLRHGAAACLLLVGLGACATPDAGAPPIAAVTPPSAVSSRTQPLGAGWAEFLGTAPEGATATLPGTGGVPVTVTAGDAYSSASGLACRHYQVAENRRAGAGNRLRVACASPDGWRATRAVVATTIGE